MTGRIIAVLFCFLTVCVNAQVPGNTKTADSTDSSVGSGDALIKHLNAAEEFQRTGNLPGAERENRAVLALALERAALVAIEEGEYEDAVKHIRASLGFSETPARRTSLAIALMRQGKFDEAAKEGRAAVALDPEHVGAHYVLSNIYYTDENYEAALQELEWVFQRAPDFEIARALGFTYLSLKQIEKARAHFERTLGLLNKVDAGIHVLFAKFYERTNYPGDAERELKRALELDPAASLVNLYLGYLLMQQGGADRMHEAYDAFIRQIKLTPDNFYSHFYAGVAATTDNKHEQAIPHLKRAIELDPASGEAHLFLGQSQMALDDLEGAEKNLRRAVELEKLSERNTQSRRTHFLLGRLLMKIGKREEGRQELELANRLQKDALDSSRDNLDKILGQVGGGNTAEKDEDKPFAAPEKPKLSEERVEQLGRIRTFLKGVIAQSYSNLGVIATQGSRISEAIADFSRAYEWDPDFPSLSRNLGIVRFRNADYEASAEPLSRHLSSNPGDALARKLLGSSYYFTGQFEKAVETLKPIEGQIVADAELAYFYGLSLVRIERNPDAIPVFEAISARYPDDPSVLLNVGQGFMIAGEYARAVKELEKVIRLAPQTAKANYFMGQSLLRLNRNAEAEKAFEAEIAVSPGDPISRYHLALSLIERRADAERAESLLREAIGLRSGYADAHYQLGKMFLERGEVDRAISELETAVRSNSEKDYIHYQLSIAYRRASRMEDAERELELYRKLKDAKRNTDVPMPMGPDQSSPSMD